MIDTKIYINDYTTEEKERVSYDVKSKFSEVNQPRHSTSTCQGKTYIH